jgi:hypothetical protein
MNRRGFEAELLQTANVGSVNDGAGKTVAGATGSRRSSVSV